MAQIILVMIWVVLPPAGEEYCCIQKVLLKPYLQLLVALRAWRRCLTLRVMCAHKRAAQHAALACACLIWRCISSGLRLVRCGWSVVGVPVRLSSHSAPAAPHAPGCPSGRLWRQAVRVQWVGCRVFLFGTLSWRCRVLATPVPLPQHRMPSAVLLGGGRGRRFGGAGGRWLFRSSLVPCGSGDVLALLGSLVCFAALVVLRVWRPRPALRGMCAHAACPGGVPHARSTTSAAFASACLIWRCAFLFFFGLGAVVLFEAVGAKMCGRGLGPAHSRCCALRCCTAAFPHI